MHRLGRGTEEDDVRGRVLLVSADPILAAEVERAFEGSEQEVFVARDELEAILFLDRELCDAVLLEVEKPGAEGFAFCGVVRRSWDVAITLLLRPAAQRDVVLGYQMGADTYLNLPFEGRELLARVGALVRQVQLARSREASRARATMPSAWRLAGNKS